MLTPEQKAARRHSVGASEVAAICGLSPYDSPMDVFLEKRGLALDEEEQSDAAAFGSYMEGGVLQHYADKFPRVQLERNTGPSAKTMANPKHAWATATPDAFATLGDQRYLVEAKTAGYRMLDQWGDGPDEVPPYYLVQCQWQAFVSGHSRVDLHAALDRTFRTYPLQADDELIGLLFEQVQAFWIDTQNGKAPSIDGSDASARYLSQLYSKVKAEKIEADADAMAWAQELRAVYREVERLEARKSELKNYLCQKIGEAAGMVHGLGSFSWSKPATRSKTDWEALARKHASAEEIDAATRTFTTGRVFRPYWKKEPQA